MKKIFLVAQREFGQKVRSRAFLFSAIVTPLILFAIWYFSGALDLNGQEEPGEDPLAQAPSTQAIGYVDQADLIKTIPAPLSEEQIRPFADVEAAQAALDRDEISAYYLVPSDYEQTGEVQRVSVRLPVSPPDTSLFDWVLVSNLFPEANREQLERMRSPFGQTSISFVPISVSADGEGDAVDEGSNNTMLPFVVTIAVMIPLFTGGGYLLQSLTQEKGSRVMEILLLSLKPRQLLTGKLLGLGLLVVVQYGIWMVIGTLVLTLTGQDATRFLAGIQLSVNEVILIIPYALGGFGLYAALMAGIGALAPDMEGSRAWTFMITLPMMLPMYLWMAIVNSPQGVLALILSLFPYSAPVAMMMRMTATAVPAWQLGVSLGLLLLAVVGTIWLMARLFHAKTLLSGEALSLARFRAALQES
jgi:ABC-2 type transport system permease protein